jgi:D-inositol-3-phosphate glycosyltransferase
MFPSADSTIRHVALVSEHASPRAPLGGPDAGGQNVYIAGLATELGRRGVQVTVYTRRHARKLPAHVDFAPGVSIEYIDAGPCAEIPKDKLLPHLSAFASALRLRWAVESPDIVHAHYWMSGLVSLDAVAAFRIPYIQTFHALGVVKRRVLRERDTSSPERIPAEARLARIADAVVATSTSEVGELARLLTPGKWVRVVPCGVDTNLFSPDGPTEPKSRRKRIVMVGRLVRRKGMDEVVRALTKLPAAELLIVGESMGDDSDADRLRAVAQAAGVEDRVEIRKAVPNNDVPRLLRSADLVVCFPWYEPFGIVAIEAMACGRPVLASAVGGLRETVVTGETGILVGARDLEGFIQSAASLLADDTLRAKLGEAGRRRAVEVYDWRRIVDRILEIYITVRRHGGGRIETQSLDVASR